MSESSIKKGLLQRKKELTEKLKALRPLQDELAEVERLLETYNPELPRRSNWGCEGRENGCRCRQCDPSW